MLFWQTTHLRLPKAYIKIYFSIREKCWLRGGVGGRFPRNVLWFVRSRWLDNEGNEGGHEQAWSIKDIIIGSKKNFSLRDQRAKSRPRGQGPILPARVANQNTGFARSCCPRIQPYIHHFEVARETGSRWLSKCIVGLFLGTHFQHGGKFVPKTVPQCALATLSTRSKWPIGWFSNRTGTSVNDGARKLNNWLDQVTNGRAANWVPEVVFSPFCALSRRQLTFPSCC